MKKILTLTFASLVFPILAFAGPQYIDETGFAISGHDAVAYFDLKQKPVGQTQNSAIKGDASITTEFNGATWAFSSKANKRKFLKNPSAYIPQYDGHCAYGVSRGGKVPANPNLWRIVDNKLYLNVTKDVVGFWEENIPKNLNIANNNWPGLKNNKASTRTIPFYTSSAPTQ